MIKMRKALPYLCPIIFLGGAVLIGLVGLPWVVMIVVVSVWMVTSYLLLIPATLVASDARSQPTVWDTLTERYVNGDMFTADYEREVDRLVRALPDPYAEFPAQRPKAPRSSGASVNVPPPIPKVPTRCNRCDIEKQTREQARALAAGRKKYGLSTLPPMDALPYPIEIIDHAEPVTYRDETSIWQDGRELYRFTKGESQRYV